MSPEPILTLQIIYTLTKMVNGLGFQNSVTRKKKKFYRNTHQFKFIPVIQENTFSVSIGIAHKSSGFLQIKWKIWLKKIFCNNSKEMKLGSIAQWMPPHKKIKQTMFKGKPKRNCYTDKP